MTEADRKYLTEKMGECLHDLVMLDIFFPQFSPCRRRDVEIRDITIFKERPPKITYHGGGLFGIDRIHECGGTWRHCTLQPPLVARWGLY